MNEGRPSAGDILRQRLAEKGWTQADLAQIIGKTTAAVNEIIQRKRSISSEMAALLAAALGTSAEFWLTLDAGSRVPDASLGDAKRRSHLYEIAPVREMIRRGWINPAPDLARLEEELRRFFGTDSLEAAPSLAVATRRSEPHEELKPAQLAWCFRARNLAADLIVPPFDPARLDDCEAELKNLLAFAPQTKKVPQTLSRFGVRLVVVEPLSGSKIDGAALWVDEDKPVIALSLRMDRIDSFWYTLFHEWSHIRHKDGLSVDSSLTGEDATFSAVKPSFERRADGEAATSLIPAEKMTSFIHRIAPLYSKERIIQFAHRMRVHPGIILGQLQHRGEVRFSANRELLVKIRHKVTSAAVVDGWGNSIA